MHTTSHCIPKSLPLFKISLIRKLQLGDIYDLVCQSLSTSVLVSVPPYLNDGDDNHEGVAHDYAKSDSLRGIY